MYQVIKQTPEEQFEMYAKLPKEDIIKMLIECNRVLATNPPFIIEMAGEITKSKLKTLAQYSRLKGEFEGWLSGILHWEIPEELKKKIETKLKELKDDK